MAGMVGAAQDNTSRVSVKGKKFKVDSGDIVMIQDLEAQTSTTINNARKTVSVRSLKEAAATTVPDIRLDVKETGQQKLVNGFNAKEILMNMEMTMDSPGGRGPMKMQSEISVWISTEVPGAEELRALGGSMADVSGAGAGGASMQSAMKQIQKKLSGLQGIPVQQIVRVKSPSGAGGMPQISGEQAAKMQDGLAQARAQLEAMVKQGGPAAAIAQQQLARLPGGAPAADGGGSSLMEMTIDFTSFSTASIPASAFEIPAGYQTIQ